MPKEDLVIDFREVGATGLKRFSGFVLEEFLPELIGQRAARVYREMSLNDPTISAALFAIKMLCRKVSWRSQPASNNQADLEAAEFLETCMNDMSTTWGDMVNEALSMIEYGFAPHELVYKRRCGDVFDPSLRSKHTDGRIGWRKIPIRSQETIFRWQFDDHGGIQGFEQLAPPHYYHVTIPIEKLLLFRTTTIKNNPEGLSILRGAYRHWYMKKNIENIEAIGIERDLAGLPMAMVPAEIMSKNATAAQKDMLERVKQIVTNVRRDEQEGIVFPMIYGPEGKPMYDFKLLSTGGQRQFDTDKIINRYDQRIAMTMLADFLMLGSQDKGGSYSLVKSRTKLFATAVGAFLDMICEVFNRYAIPRLFALNDFQVTEYPTIVHGDLEDVDLKELGDYISALAGSGVPLFPNAELEKYLLKVAHLPEPPDMEATQDMQVEEGQQAGEPKTVTEIPPDANEKPSGLNTPSDLTPVNGKPPVNGVVTNNTGDVETLTNRGAAKTTAEALQAQKRFPQI